MAGPKRTRLDSPLVTVLKKIGCVYCAGCRGFMYPDHAEHVTAFDRHTRETFPPAPVTLTAEWPMPADVAA